MSDRISKFIQTEIDQINVHLPIKVMSLANLIKSEQYEVQSRDGSIIQFDQKEIEFIKQLIPKNYWNQVLLPIIITRRRDLGAGSFTVGGSDPNLYIILSLFEKLPKYEIWKINKRESYVIYKPQLKKIRKELDTTTTIAFS